MRSYLIPVQCGQKFKIEKLGREWKGRYAFDKYDKVWEIMDLYCDQNTGQWMLSALLNFNGDKLVESSRSWFMALEVAVCQCKFVSGRNVDFKHCVRRGDFHRPSNTIRHCVDRYEKGDKTIDYKFCQQWLQAYEQRKQSLITTNSNKKKKNDSTLGDASKEKAPKETNKQKSK